MTASARSLPALMCSIVEEGAKSLDLAAEQIGERGSAAAIRHVHHVGAGHHLEQLAGDMGRVPLPPTPC